MTELQPPAAEFEPLQRRRAAIVIAAMTLITLVMACGLYWKTGADAQFEDPDGWGRMGRQVASGKGLLEGGKPSAFRGPIVPLVFAGFIKIGGDSSQVLHATQCLFFAVANGVLGVVAWRIFQNWIVTLLSMLIYIGFVPAHPWFLNIFTEPIFTTVLAVFVLLWMVSIERGGGWSFAAGLALVVAALTRPVMYFFLPFVLGYELFQRGLSRSALRSCLAIILGMLTLEIPWVARNLVVLGKPILTTSGSTQALFLATWYQEANWLNNPFHDKDRFPLSAQGFWKLSHEKREAQFAKMARDNWQSDPMAVLMLVPKRAVMFLFQLQPRGWIPTPKSIVLAGGLYTLAAFGYWLISPVQRRRYAPVLLLLLFNVAFHAALVSEYRYSHPIQPYVFMLSAAGVYQIYWRFIRRATAQEPSLSKG